MLRDKAEKAVLWSGLDTLIRRGFGFGISVALARLLTPDDFGTVALLSLLIGVASLFVDAGLGMALIQRQDVTREDESTVFWFNLIVAFVMMLGLCAGAEWIAEFFEKPVLVPLTIILALNIFIGALGTIHGTLMTKRLDFKTPMKVGVSTSIAGGLVAVHMAWDGYGLWALVGQTLTASVLGVALLWRWSTWRPALIFSPTSFKKLFGFSGWLFLSWLLDVVYQRGYTALIGKFYGTHDLGIYNRADSMQSLASGVMTDVLSKAAFPLFSAINNDIDRMKRGMRVAVQTMMLITTPTMMGLAVLAEPLIALVFGERWRPAAPILQVLCFVGLLYPLHVINLNVLQAHGRSNLFFRLELAKKSSGVALLILGSFYGLLGIAVARGLSSLVALGLNGFYTGKFLNYGIKTQIKDSGTSVVFSLAMAFVVFTIHDRLSAKGPIGAVDLVALIAFGAFIYLSLNSLCKAEAYLRVRQIARGKAI